MDELDFTRLSQRQREILLLLSHGYTTRGAAAFLGITRQTTQTYIGSALRVTHAKTRAQMVAGFVRSESQGL